MKLHARAVETDTEVDLSGLADTCALDVAARGPHQLVQVASKMGVVRERARQVEMSAIYRLKAQSLLPPEVFATGGGGHVVPAGPDDPQ